MAPLYSIAMVTETQPVDDQYLNGLWHNGETGEFEKYGLSTDNNEVHIYDEDHNLLDTVEYLETGHLVKVDEKAVTNPVAYYEEIVSHLINNTTIEEHLPYEVEISFKYASENVKIVEQE